MFVARRGTPVPAPGEPDVFTRTYCPSGARGQASTVSTNILPRWGREITSMCAVLPSTVTSLQPSCPAGAERSHLCAPCSRRLSPLYKHPAPLEQRSWRLSFSQQHNFTTLLRIG